MKNSFRTKSLLMKSSRRFEIDGYPPFLHFVIKRWAYKEDLRNIYSGGLHEFLAVKKIVYLEDFDWFFRFRAYIFE